MSEFNALAINLTNSCNLKCRHCFQEAIQGKTPFIDKDSVFKILGYFSQKIDKSQKKYVQFTGGEIFLHPDLFQILDYCLDNGWILRLQTNATLVPSIPKEKFKILKKTDIYSSFRVSLDGWDQETHGFLRPAESFEKVVEGIKILKKYMESITIKTVIHKSNFPHLEKLFDFALSLGVVGISTNDLRLEGYAKDVFTQKDVISQELVIKKLVALFNEPKYSKLICANNLLHYYKKKIRNIGGGHFYIDYTGDVFANQQCLKSQYFGNIYVDNYDNIFKADKLPVNGLEEITPTMLQYVLENLKPEVVGIVKS